MSADAWSSTIPGHLIESNTGSGRKNQFDMRLARNLPVRHAPHPDLRRLLQRLDAGTVLRVNEPTAQPRDHAWMTPLATWTDATSVRVRMIF